MAEPERFGLLDPTIVGKVQQDFFTIKTLNPFTYAQQRGQLSEREKQLLCPPVFQEEEFLLPFRSTKYGGDGGKGGDYTGLKNSDYYDSDDIRKERERKQKKKRFAKAEQIRQHLLIIMYILEICESQTEKDISLIKELLTTVKKEMVNQIQSLNSHRLTKIRDFLTACENLTLNDPSLTSMDVSKNKIRNVGNNSTLALSHEIRDEGVQYLAAALQFNSTLTSLELDENRITHAGAQHLARALQTNSTLTRLQIGGNTISEAGAQQFAVTLQSNSSLTSLDLGYNEIGEAGTGHLSQALQSNSTLMSLELDYNKIGDAGVQHLATALQSNSSLTQLILGGNHIREAGVQHLATALQFNSSLTSLHLRNNEIGEEAAQHLATALQSNSSLTSLHLGWNRIGDAGVQHLATALQSNSSLTSLHLEQNQIGEAGVQHLATALQSNSSLTSLNLANNQIGKKAAQYLANALQFNSTLTSVDLNQPKTGKESIRSSKPNGWEEMNDKLERNKHNRNLRKMTLVHLLCAQTLERRFFSDRKTSRRAPTRKR